MRCVDGAVVWTKGRGRRNATRTHFITFAGVTCPNSASSLRMLKYVVSFHWSLFVAVPKYSFPAARAARFSPLLTGCPRVSRLGAGRAATNTPRESRPSVAKLRVQAMVDSSYGRCKTVRRSETRGHQLGLSSVHIPRDALYTLALARPRHREPQRMTFPPARTHSVCARHGGRTVHPRPDIKARGGAYVPSVRARPGIGRRRLARARVTQRVRADDLRPISGARGHSQVVEMPARRRRLCEPKS